MDTTPVDATRDSEPLDHDYIDRNYIKLGCADVLKDVIQIFIDSAPEKVENIKLSSAKSEYTFLAKYAHGLKGESGSVGARLVNRLAAAIEHAARREDLEEARNLIPELEAELQRAMETLTREYLV